MCKGYTVYSYEFGDRHVYVGLTANPKDRKWHHAAEGPVYNHRKVCSIESYKVLETGLSESDAKTSEHKWQEHYKSDGWKALWSSKPGGLGRLCHPKWDRESVLTKAKEFKARKAWRLGHQYTYNLARREGWLEDAAAAAHMPRRLPWSESRRKSFDESMRIRRLNCTLLV
jgi:predicted GIY-YIG superfamily endonuclease